MDVLNFLMTLMKFIQKITFMFVVSMMMELQHLANVGLMLGRLPRQVFEFLGSFSDWPAQSLARADSSIEILKTIQSSITWNLKI